MHPRFRIALAAVLACLTLTTATRAGEVRVNISNFFFTPIDVYLNMGDHVVWIWTGGSHSTTSGDVNGPAPDGIWDSGVQGPLSEYSWKADRVDVVAYYCILHAASYMAGTVNIYDAGISAADFRVTELQYNVAGGLDLIEITNLGGDAGDLGRYRMSISPGVSAAVAPLSFNVPPGGRVVLHAHMAGIDNPTNIYMPSLGDLPDIGSFTLYVPFNVFGASLDNPNQLVDFIEWGAAGGPHEAAAVTAGLWRAGEYVPAVGANHSMEFCGTPGQYGAPHWGEATVPNFGFNGGCVTPTVRSSWGRIKTLYR